MSEESEIIERGSQVDALLVKKDKAKALLTSLQNPPVSSKSDEVKVLFICFRIIFIIVNIIRKLILLL